MNKLFKTLLIISCLLFCTPKATAYLEINETADLLPDDTRYRVGFFPQIYLDEADLGGGKKSERGTNFGAFLDMYVDRDINTRFTLGGGATDLAGAAATAAATCAFGAPPDAATR